MAEIDKILPNVSQNVNLPSASKVALEQQQQMAEQMKQPSEVQPNEDGSVDIADAIFMLYTLMLNGPQSGCADATDSNDSGTHDIADAVFILTYQFAGGSAPPSPGADVCGVDATPDDGMSCDSYSGCP